MEYRKFEVETKNIKVRADRGRKDFGDIDDLADSIATYGLIHPIVVTNGDTSGSYILVAGERRLRATLLNGETTISCTLFENLSDHEQKSIELEENLRRSDLSWIEEIVILKQLDEAKKSTEGQKLPGPGPSQGWTQRKTAELVGISPASASERIKLARLLDERKDIRDRVKSLPLKVAMKTSKQILENERLDRLQSSGKVKIDTSISLGSCLALIKDLDDESVGLIISDPPFGIPILATDTQGGGRYNYAKGGDRGPTTKLSYTSLLVNDDNVTLAQVQELFAELTPEFERVLVPGGHFYFFFAFECYHRLVVTLGSKFEVDPVPLIWNKGRVTSPFSGYSYQPCYEPILFGIKLPKSRRLVKPGKKVLDYGIIASKDKLHPFEKPLDLLRFLITRSSREGEIVLDPFSGSGATILAAKETGRTGIGFEINRDHWLSSQKRLVES